MTDRAAAEALLTTASWRKSSYSGGNDNCVEVATTATRTAVRDSKYPDLPAALTTRAAWDAFIATISDGKIR